MSESNEQPDIVPAKVAIVGKDGKTVLNKGADARDARDKPGKRSRPPSDFMKGFATREEVMEHLSTAALAVGQKMYDQMSGETAELLEEMERVITRHVIEYFESRTIRGRVKRWWRAHVTKPTPRLVVDAAEALDPNVNGVDDASGTRLTMGMVKEAIRQLAPDLPPKSNAP